MPSELFAPLVSVVIPLYNCEAFVGEAIESVLNQTYQKFEIIVVNDGSTDSSANAVRPYLRKITYIDQKNSGSAVARNEGVRAANGELIAFLDSDDVWLPHRLSLQVPLFSTDPVIGLVHSDRVLFDATTGLEFPENDYMHLKTGNGDILRDLFSYNFICTQSVMLRKACFNTVGYFDPSFRAAQDYDFWLRVSAQYKTRYISGVVTRYRIHGGQISWNFDLSYESEMRVIQKFIEQHPNLEWLTREVQRQRFSDLYFRFGHDYFQDRKMMEARNIFKESLHYNSTNFKSLFFWLLSSYGTALVQTWDRMHRKPSQL